jgi:hypothetical protein
MKPFIRLKVLAEIYTSLDKKRDLQKLRNQYEDKKAFDNLVKFARGRIRLITQLERDRKALVERRGW